MKVKGVITDSPSNRAFSIGGRDLICFSLDAEIHDVVAADGAVVDDDVPSPESNGVPLFHLEPLFAAFLGHGAGSAGRSLGDFIIDLHGHALSGTKKSSRVN